MAANALPADVMDQIGSMQMTINQLTAELSSVSLWLQGCDQGCGYRGVIRGVVTGV